MSRGHLGDPKGAFAAVVKKQNRKKTNNRVKRTAFVFAAVDCTTLKSSRIATINREPCLTTRLKDLWLKVTNEILIFRFSANDRLKFSFGQNFV